jgi:hypothetical protein
MSNALLDIAWRATAGLQSFMVATIGEAFLAVPKPPKRDLSGTSTTQCHLCALSLCEAGGAL